MFDFNAKFKNKCTSLLITVIFLFVGVAVSLVPATNTYSDKNGFDIIVPDDYSSIQNAVDNANPGDKILVRSGVYKENIIIDKEGLLLQGENKYNTVLDGCNTGEDGIFVKAENITIQRFTITNFRKEEPNFWAQAGIKIYASNVSIINNILISNRIGIEVYSQAYNTTISDNNLICDGICFGNYFNSKEYPNITKLDFTHNIKNNTANGKPLYYYTNKNDFTVPADAGQIILVNCTNATIKDLYMSKNDFPIILAYCHKCTLENLTISEADGEILLFHCENNTIQNNKISNIFKAICLEFKSKNNIVRYNDVSNNFVGISIFISANNNSIYRNKAYNNHESGIEIVSYHGGIQQDNNVSDNQIYNNRIGIYLRENSVKNIIQNNSITKNKMGVVLEKSSDYNIIRYNNFKRNPISATFIGCTKNIWYQNYWNRPRFIPMPVMGFRTFGKMFLPWINFDRHPATTM
ncbi:MAG: right-handed parallel beta-helix repeat-containing protein [Euryarchaeota archaeon]|nr:right-handed parallel beta-helix repeat-containing protein [Euryarchaeota archaeon]